MVLPCNRTVSILLIIAFLVMTSSGVSSLSPPPGRSPPGIFDYTGPCVDATADWTLNQNVTMTSGTCKVSANVTVPPEYTLTLRKVTLTITENSYSDPVTITIEGTLVLDNVTMMKSEALTAPPWQILLTSTASLYISNNSLFQNGSEMFFTDQGAANISVKNSRFDNATSTFFHLESVSNMLFEGNTFKNSSANALWMASGSNNTFKGNTYNNVSQSNWWFDGGVFLFQESADLFEGETFIETTPGLNLWSVTNTYLNNATFTGSGSTDVRLEWTATVYNRSSGIRSKIFDSMGLGGNPSKLISEVFVDMDVRWESTGASVPGATVTYYNATDSPVFTGDTDPSGAINEILMELEEETVSGKFNRTPHRLNVIASNGGRNYETNVTHDISLNKAVTVTIDDIPPVLNLSAPKDGLITNKTVITVNGTTDIPTPQRLVLVKVDYGTGVTDALVDVDGSFGLDIPLETEGRNEIRVTSTDWMGNARMAVLNVTRDTKAPSLSFSSPVNGQITNITDIIVTGSTEAGATLNVSGKTVLVNANGNFSVGMKLSEGKNTIEAVANDTAGNRMTASVNVTLDTMPPLLMLEQPIYHDVLTNNPQFVISGRTGTGENVYINEERVTLTGMSFQKIFQLTKGLQVFTVVARDNAGNTATQIINVTLDTEAPEIEITTPADKAIVNTTSVQVSGTTENGANVTIGNKDAEVDPDGSFSLTYDLTEGKNSIQVVSTDAAGNHQVRAIVVTRDTIAPLLKITSPSNGTVTSKATATIEGAAETGAKVTVDGVEVKITGGGYSVNVALEEGDNVIEVVALDSAFNRADDRVTVILDTVASLTVTEPAPGSEVANGNITVKGMSEPLAEVTVNGFDADVDASGGFSKKVRLADGPNEITVTVKDRAGNERTVWLNITVKPDTNGGGGGDDDGGSKAVSGLNLMVPLAIVALLVVAAIAAVAVMKKRKAKGKGTEKPEGAGGTVATQDNAFSAPAAMVAPAPVVQPPAMAPQPAPTEPMAKVAEVPAASYASTDAPSAAPVETLAAAPTAPVDQPAGTVPPSDESALDTLYDATEAIEEAKAAGMDVSKAENNLRLARTFMNKGRQDKAVQYATKALEALK